MSGMKGLLLFLLLGAMCLGAQAQDILSSGEEYSAAMYGNTRSYKRRMHVHACIVYVHIHSIL